MRKFTSRGLIALGIVATVGLSTPVLASAGTQQNGSAPSRTFHQDESAYRASRRAIQNTFRSAVNQAHATYEYVLAHATSSAQRSAARQTYVAAIIQAAATRSAALIALGTAPEKSGTGSGKSN